LVELLGESLIMNWEMVNIYIIKAHQEKVTKNVTVEHISKCRE
jgi:hypothetical protein